MSRRPTVALNTTTTALLGSVVVIAIVVFGILSLAPKDAGVAPPTITEPLPPVVSTPDTLGSAPSSPAAAPPAQATTPATTTPTTPVATPTPAASSKQPVPNPKTTVAEAQQNVRNGVSQVAACFTDTQNFSKCQTAADLGNTGLAIADGAPAAGEVAFSGSGSTYVVTGAAAEGLLFTATGTFTGEHTSRTCSATGGTPCPSPTWD